MDVSERAGAADRLLSVYRTHSPIAPLSETYPHMDLADAYAVQLHQVEGWVAEGRIVRGHKVGLTSRAMQKQLGVDQPDFGHLFDDMFHPDGETIEVGRYIAPKVEPEIAFALKADLTGPGISVAAAAAAVDFAIASLEIIDSRIADWRIGLVDTIADNASSGGVVLGTQPVRLEDVDLRLVGVVSRKNGRIVQTGAGAAVLGSPINALAWLANTLGALGTPLRAGDVVLPGAVSAAVAAAPGDVVSASFARLGTVTARFAS